MGIEIAAVVLAEMGAELQRAKFRGNPGHTHEDPILAKRRAAEAAGRSREARIAADLATVKRDNRVGLFLLALLLVAAAAFVASLFYGAPHPPHDNPPVHPASGNNTPANPDQDGHVLRGGSH